MDDQRDYEEEAYNRAEMDREGREELEAERRESTEDVSHIGGWVRWEQ